jgi:Zn-dependent M16 (insulinase) family peptidase
MNKSYRSASLCLFLCLSILLSTTALGQKPQPTSATFESLTAGKVVNGFRTEAIYTDESDKLFGARFKHVSTGFTLDLLKIQSVPQGHIWVNSFPTSDMGEPHTQEHLLLGKGSVGRAVSSAETMSLVTSNAFTQQLRTSYFFNTAAGPEVFYGHFERQMNALLNPNYSDEEIRREVRNFGITENPADKSLRLEEKGSVYNEMTSSMTRPNARLFRAAALTVYGPNHPLSYVSGGSPEGIRAMTPDDIKRFHAANYHLGNMGMVASVPKEMTLSDVLARTDRILTKLEPVPPKTKFKTTADLPAPQMAPAGSIKVVEYPHRNEQQPGFLVYVWPATLKLSDPELMLLELFLDNIAGDATTNFYKKFVDTKTRTYQLGAQGVFNFVSSDMGRPIYIGFNDVPQTSLTEQKIVEARQQVLDEINRIASFADGSAELAEFNDRLKNRVTDTRRTLSKFVNSPPGFGFRNTGSGWMDQLDRINETPGFKKSVTMKSEMAFVDTQVASKQNVWRDYVTKWGLTKTTPYALASRANPVLLQQDEQERLQRTTAEVARLKAKYGTSDDQETIRRYQTEYDAASNEIDEAAKKDPRIGFINTPPMTLDDQLDFKVTSLANNIPLVSSTFDNMTSATTGLALKLNNVSEEDLIYLTMMPTLLTRVGVIKDGKAISFDEVSELWKKEILSLNSSFGINSRTNRVELILRASGNDAAESKRAVEWIKLVLNHPNWGPDNLPRIRDLVDQTLGGLRNTMQGAEENWVNDPSNAYRKQDNPLIMAVGSFLTRSHNVYRLRWMLKDAGDDGPALSSLLEKLEAVGKDAKRDELKALLAALQGKGTFPTADSYKVISSDFNALTPNAKSLAADAAKDLDTLLNDIPDSSLGTDWAYLARQLTHDLTIPPQETLANLERVRQMITRTGNARLFVIGSAGTQKQLEPGIQALVGSLQVKEFSPVSYKTNKLVDERLRERVKDATNPVYVGLMNPNTQSGVIMNSAPLVNYADLDPDSLLRYIASKLYGGGGSHGVFTKTIGAGLAYSNGIGSSPTNGRETYYAERTPEIPQTLKFVIDEIKKSPRDPCLTDYAIAQAFLEFRSASTYESRGESMAADIADGVLPDTARRFRQAVLDLRKLPNLADELYDRMGPVYAKILPGYDPQLKPVPGSVYFVIGNDKQFVAYEAYLKSTLGPETQLYRLYPRDFWMPLKVWRATNKLSAPRP